MSTALPPGARGGKETRATMPVDVGVGVRTGECEKVAQGSACRGFKVRIPPPASSETLIRGGLATEKNKEE